MTNIDSQRYTKNLQAKSIAAALYRALSKEEKDPDLSKTLWTPRRC